MTNRMGVVPDNIGKLQKCGRIGLSANGLRTLPPQLAELAELEGLDLYNNRLRAPLPELTGPRALKKVFIRDPGLSLAEAKTSFPRAELVQTEPPELDRLLRRKSLG